MGRLAINGSGWPTFSPDTASPNTVIVKQGDTLEKIARSLNTDLKDLMAANGIKGPNQTILAGQELKIPLPNTGAVPAPKEPLQVHSSPMGGTVDPAWEGKHQLRNATIHDLIDKAGAAGLDASTVDAMVAKLGAMPDSQLVRSASLLHHSLNSANAREQFINTLGGLGVQVAGARSGVGEAAAGAGAAAAGGAAEAGKAGASAGASPGSAAGAVGAAAGGAAAGGGAEAGKAGASAGASPGSAAGAGGAAARWRSRGRSSRRWSSRSRESWSECGREPRVCCGSRWSRGERPQVERPKQGKLERVRARAQGLLREQAEQPRVEQPKPGKLERVRARAGRCEREQRGRSRRWSSRRWSGRSRESWSKCGRERGALRERWSSGGWSSRREAGAAGGAAEAGKAGASAGASPGSAAGAGGAAAGGAAEAGKRSEAGASPGSAAGVVQPQVERPKPGKLERVRARARGLLREQAVQPQVGQPKPGKPERVRARAQDRLQRTAPRPVQLPTTSKAAAEPLRRRPLD